VTESTLSTFVALDGDNLVLQDWPLPDDQPLRGVVLLVHGLGEHAWRYDALAQRLSTWGFAVRGYDQYGHGESGGVRGGLPSDSRLLDDLTDVLESTRARMPANTPLILLGHSLGGLLAARWVAANPGCVQGLVLSSPAFDLGLSGFQKILLALLSRIAPDLRLGNGINPTLISHDPAVVAAYRADKLIHRRISARVVRFMLDTARATLAQAPQWQVPTLLLYAGADRIVNPAGSQAFAAAAPSAVVSTQVFDGLYHELFNELDAEPVFKCLQRWLDALIPATPALHQSAPPARPNPN
jgi:alpha-beta hydrolase superfamily lysophospholipase